MILESVRLINFRCFGPNSEQIKFDSGLTALIGSNGTGKTAFIQGMLRLFGINSEHRRIRRQDFHIPSGEKEPPTRRDFIIDTVFAFPEIKDPTSDLSAIPQFFQQMAADGNGRLKFRLRLTASWIDDGSTEGLIDQKLLAVRNLADPFTEAECSELTAVDRTRIQMIYVPASRDGASQITNFLKGRLWKAINWSSELKTKLSSAGEALNKAFSDEIAIGSIAQTIKSRWNEVYLAGTDTIPIFRPVDLRFPEFIKKAEVIFHPDEEGKDRSMEDLSDGQRSLFHISLTAATLDIEDKILKLGDKSGFQSSNVSLPALTLIAIEEPENNLAPFYLSRIITQIQDLTQTRRVQGIVSSHSPSILARVDPEQIRYFRIDSSTRSAHIKSIELPKESEAAAKFVREAVRSYPELYFAKFVVLGEGTSEEVVIPRVAEAMNVSIDRSFVSIVPLGGRHVNHLWKLLTNLDIPFATLLDADVGRVGGGWGRIKTVCEQLIVNGVDPSLLFKKGKSTEEHLEFFLNAPLASRADIKMFKDWVQNLRNFNVFFCFPLDLDWIMLGKFLDDYKKLPEGNTGPKGEGDPRAAVLGEKGDDRTYKSSDDEMFIWYRYLFLGRSKPATHIRALASIDNEKLRKSAPEALKELISHIDKVVFATK